MSSKNLIFDNLKKRVALGNTRRGFKEVASDLLNATNMKPQAIAAGTFLSPSTVARVMDCDEDYRPQAETIERCLRFCNAEVEFRETDIKAQYANRPKQDH